LYGASVRGGDRISDLISYGKKKVSVTVLLEVDEREVEITRSGPPARVYFDGKQVEQSQIETLVGRTKRQFLNSVVFGQGVPLLIDLPIPERGDLLDEILDLQVWMRASDLAGKKYFVLQGELNKLRVEIGHTEGGLESLPDITAIKELSDKWEVGVSQKREAVRSSIDEARHAVEKMHRQFRRHEKSGGREPSSIYAVLREQEKQAAELQSQLAVLRSDRTRVIGDLGFFRENSRCPSCEQEIASDLATAHIEKHESELQKIEGNISAVSRRGGQPTPRGAGQESSTPPRVASSLV
jgi:DNA repair exonuclease SbcCD ATPase subunit